MDKYNEKYQECQTTTREHGQAKIESVFLFIFSISNSRSSFSYCFYFSLLSFQLHRI